MKRFFVVVLVVALLFSVLTGTRFVRVGIANPVPPTTEIKILSPQSNGSYSGHSVPLVFEVIEYHGTTSYLVGTSSIRYYVDGEEAGSFDGSEFTGRGLSKTFSVDLAGLSAGCHIVKVTKNATFNLIMTGYSENVSSRTVGFLVTSPLEISVMLPENVSYSADSLSLDFAVNEPVLWMGYSLDGKTNQTVGGNTTLNDLSYGSHNLTIYATDVYVEKWASGTVYFSLVQEKELFAELFPALLAVVAIVTVAVVLVCLLFYFKKRKH